MREIIATIVFYDWTTKKEDTKKILRIQRFARREHLPIVQDILEYTSGIPFYLSAGTFEEGITPPSVPRCEHRYFLSISAANPVRMHLLVSLLEAYAAYCGIHSRLYSWKENQ